MTAREEGRLSFGYVRQRYGVPAGRGVRVTVNGKPGRITSGAGNYIRVLFDGERFSRICHPVWRMLYHVPPASVVPFCPQCTHELDDAGDCFECGTGKYARDCKCGRGDWLCPWHQGGEDCRGVDPRPVGRAGGGGP